MRRSGVPPRLWAGLCLFGVFVAVTFAVLPVGVRFDGDPLLRLRDLDPQLSPPEATAVCGPAVRNLDVSPRSTELFEVARARACEDAARRRVAVSMAVGALLVVAGLVGRAGGPSRLRPGDAVAPGPNPPTSAGSP
ncbi:MAG: hypothetical protein AB1673_05575 [Actinomycetota bacterium]